MIILICCPSFNELGICRCFIGQALVASTLVGTCLMIGGVNKTWRKKNSTDSQKMIFNWASIRITFTNIHSLFGWTVIMNTLVCSIHFPESLRSRSTRHQNWIYRKRLSVCFYVLKYHLSILSFNIIKTRSICISWTLLM